MAIMIMFAMMVVIATTNATTDCAAMALMMFMVAF